MSVEPDSPDKANGAAQGRPPAAEPPVIPPPLPPAGPPAARPMPAAGPQAPGRGGFPVLVGVLVVAGLLGLIGLGLLGWGVTRGVFRAQVAPAPPPVAKPVVSAPSPVPEGVVAEHRVHEAFYPPVNPGPVWSFGWVSEPGGRFTPLEVFKLSPDDRRQPVCVWSFARLMEPAVCCNTNAAEAVCLHGKARFPPNTVWFFPGLDGRPEHFGVIRFTVPEGEGGRYRVVCVARGYCPQPPAGDTDFHVLVGGREVFSRFLDRGGSASFAGTFPLKANETVDFVVGRGADESGVGSGLILKATVSRLR